MENAGRLAGRKALITGAGTGIGREIALEFARQGADVVLHYAHSSAGAESAMAEIRAMGRRATALAADFDRVEKVRELAPRAVEFLGGLDCLVNNAGITMNKPFLQVTPQQFDTLYHVNVRAQFFLTQAAVEHMSVHGGGSICNLTSVHGLQGAPEHTVYAGTKGAIIAYTRTLGIELAHRGIRVNAIAPGWILVENHLKAMPGFTGDAFEKMGEQMIPAARIGHPLDVAKLAVFLCSEDAGFIVGQTFVVDGGSTALMSLFTDFRTASSARFGAGYVAGM
jgi:NAD(P)-dependent dehydrogenase (short-subunit alcohol dehydrogenase family)